MTSRPSSATPSGSPIAPIAVVNSPGMTTTWTPVSASRSRTASTSASAAPGCITIIIGADGTSAGAVPDRLELRMPEQAGEAACPGGPDAPGRHRQRPADVLVADRRVAGEQRDEPALALRQRRERAA